MDFKPTGSINKIKDTQTGTSANGEWKKLEFVIENNEGYEGKKQEFCFEIFGAEKVDKFLEYNSVGKTVDVSFNISTNEWKDKHFTSLAAWKVFGATAGETAAQPVAEVVDDLPF